MLASRSLPSIWLLLTGTGLILLGISHLPVWWITGSNWEGAISWRKPILFGISTGLTVFSLGLLLSKIQPRTYDAPVSIMLCVSLAVEVGLIALQQWRGVASHFNNATLIDRCIDKSITILIAIAFAIIVNYAWRTMISIQGSPAERLAWRAGMAFLFVSCIIGFIIFFYGQRQHNLGHDPSLFGTAGVPKFPHGIAIHALQILPLLVWLGSRLNLPSIRLYRIAHYGTLLFSAMLIYSLLQTISGRSRWDFFLPSQPAAILSGLFFVAIILCFCWPTQKHLHSQH